MRNSGGVVLVYRGVGEPADALGAAIEENRYHALTGSMLAAMGRR